MMRLTSMLTGFMLLALVLLGQKPTGAAQVPVRFPEATVRGFLVLNSNQGGLLASGDFLQVKRGAEVETRTVFHFKDGSLFDEKALFAEQGSFRLQSYRLLQKGPAFSQDMDASLDARSGKYLVRIRGHKDGREKVYEGELDLPSDVYNGMIPVVIKNLRAGAKETVHMVAFTPTPKLIGLEMAPTGENKVMVGTIEKTVVHYVLKPKLDLGIRIAARLLGRLPPDNQMWVMTSEVPAFVRFEGPLYPEGPIWQIELTSPRWMR